MIETAIDSWLNSLTGVPDSEEVRKQFRQGISKIAEQADMQNAAWEVMAVMLQLLLDENRRGNDEWMGADCMQHQGLRGAQLQHEADRDAHQHLRGAREDD